MKRIFFMIGVLSFGVFPAQAADLPQFDIATYCKKVADTSGGSSMIELGCRDMENEAKSALLKMSIPDKMLTYCGKVAQTSGGSYTLLQGCVDMEMEAQQKLEVK